MGSLTSKEIHNIAEAYNSIYKSQGQIICEEVLDEFHQIINELIDEGHDFSDFTWEELDEMYIENFFNPEIELFEHYVEQLTVIAESDEFQNLTEDKQIEYFSEKNIRLPGWVTRLVGGSDDAAKSTSKILGADGKPLPSTSASRGGGLITDPMGTLRRAGQFIDKTTKPVRDFFANQAAQRAANKAAREAAREKAEAAAKEAQRRAAAQAAQTAEQEAKQRVSALGNQPKNSTLVDKSGRPLTSSGANTSTSTPKPQKSAKPAQPAQPAQSARPAQPAQSAKPAQPAQPAQSAQSAQSAQPPHPRNPRVERIQRNTDYKPAPSLRNMWTRNQNQKTKLDNAYTRLPAWVRTINKAALWGSIGTVGSADLFNLAQNKPTYTQSAAANVVGGTGDALQGMANLLGKPGQDATPDTIRSWGQNLKNIGYDWKQNNEKRSRDYKKQNQTPGQTSGQNRNQTPGQTFSPIFGPPPTVKEHFEKYLIENNYADNKKSARAIMEVMSEKWKESILNG